MQQIAIIGLGYVGLPLALQFCRNGVTVIGLDTDPDKLNALAQGSSYIKHIPEPLLREQINSGRFKPRPDFAEIKNAEAVIICVPTPLTKHREPDISYILKSAEAIAPFLQRGQLVVLESTTYPGTTEDELRRVLEELSGLRAGEDFHLAFSPEREDPGNPESKVGEIPKIVGGYSDACLQKAVALYQQAVKTVIPVSSTRVAEAVKLLENIFRCVNIALINELKVVYSAMGIDVWEVIAAARTKPFGFMPFYPGPGLGGHCVPIDPFYLTWKAREYGQHTRFIELAGEINTSMPAYVVHRLVEALNSRKQALSGSKILVLGLAYKANVDDIRESASFTILSLVKQGGGLASYYDPFVPVIPTTRNHPDWAGLRSVAWNRETIASFDAVVICTAHQRVNYEELASWSGCVIDTRNAIPHAKPNVWKA